MDCPNCKSDDIEYYDYIGVKVMRCRQCGYDESESFQAFPEENKSQKAKGIYSPYKTGGSRRTKK